VRRLDPTMIIFLAIMAYMTITGGRFASPMGWLMSTLLVLPGIIVGITFHEFAHAYSAYKLGDYTPKVQRRVSLNPFRHLDPIGLICIIFVGFGWGKPVMVNPVNFKKKGRDDIIVSLAGVVTNFILAVLLTVVATLIYRFALPFLFTATGEWVYTSLIFAININLVLMVFNLLPVPPLDGFNVITGLLGIQYTDVYYKMYQYGMFILMALIVFGVVRTLIGVTVNPLGTLLMNLAGLSWVLQVGFFQ